MEHFSGHNMKQKAIRKRARIYHGEQCLTNLTTFYNKMTRFVNKRETADSIYFVFSKTFNESLVPRF